MACRKRSPTALERYANSMQKTLQDLPLQYPMYTVPVKDVLEMAKIRSHEELFRDDLLVEFHSNMGKAAFISHQWCSPWTPDPELSQFKHLQSVLKDILASSEKQVHPHIAWELQNPFGFMMGIDVAQFRSRPLFIWYDYFSVPQINDMKWSTADFEKPIQQALESIPDYIARCEFFFVLAPVVETPDRTELLGPSTWARRGWCRLEKALKELQPQKTYIVINGEHRCWTIDSPIISFLVGGGPPGEGTFGFKEDYTRLGRVLRDFFRRLILHYLEQKNFAAYRFYLNFQSVYMKGFPASSTDDFHVVPTARDATDLENSESLAAQFLLQLGLSTVKQIDSSGWSPLCYACLRGDALLVRSLLEEKADPNTKTRRHEPFFGVQKGVTALSIAVFFSHNQAAKVLIEARASISSGAFPVITMAAQANNVEGVRLLCQASDRPCPRLSLPFAASTSAVEAIRELLSQLSQNKMMDLSGALSGAMLFNGGTAELVQELVKAKADVNEVDGPVKQFFYLLNFKYRCGSRSPAARIGRLGFGATPLMLAIATGQYEGAAALIVARANLDAKNYRRQTALDLAREFRAPQFLVDALENNPAACQRMVNSALTNRHQQILVPDHFLVDAPQILRAASPVSHVSDRPTLTKL